MTELLVLLSILALAPDTTRVRATNAPLWGPSITLRQRLLIGDVDGPPETAFGTIQLLAATRNGAFFTYDAGDKQLRRYDSSGRFLSAVGRRGAGPGEYSDPFGLALLGDSLLAVWDPANTRATIFGTDGGYRRSISVIGTSCGRDVPTIADLDGTLLICTESSSSGTTARHYQRYSAEGRLLETLPFGISKRDGIRFVLWTNEGPRWNFPSESLFARYPGGELRAHSDFLAYVQQGPGGSTRLVERPATHLPLAGVERAQWNEYGQLGAQRSGQPAPSLPAEKPIARSILGDPAGRIWIEIYTSATQRPLAPRKTGDTRPQFTWREPLAFEVFNPSGSYLGRIALPPNAAILTITPTQLWARLLGPDDQEQIAAYDLPSVR